MSINKWFTLVELIVVITILAILGTIGFISLSGYAVIARDTTRVSDITVLTKGIELYKLHEGFFPTTTDPINVTFSGAIIWKQWSFGEDSIREVRRVSEVPTDPLTGSEYAYSVTSKTGEYQVGVIVERKNSLWYFPWVSESYANNILTSFASTKIKGNYNGKFITHSEDISPTVKEIWILWVPSILLTDISSAVWNTIDLSQVHANNLFVYEWTETAPYTYSWSLEPYTPEGLWMTQTIPNNPSNLIEVIYQGTNDDLSTGSGKIDLITNIQDYYASSDVLNSSGFPNVDPVANTNGTIALANVYINTWYGGLFKEILGISETYVDTTVLTWPESTGIPCNFDTHNFDECDFS
jgi:prepilin-type N-terminal cleavage/methylation domain-containing protein